jgi:hypothetical protein
VGSVISLAGQGWSDVGAELASESKAGVSQQGIEAGNDLRCRLVGRSQRARSDGGTHWYPSSTHVLELQRTGSRVFEVSDQLSQNPRLVWIGYSSVFLLHEGFREHGEPRHRRSEMTERRSSETSR